MIPCTFQKGYTRFLFLQSYKKHDAHNVVTRNVTAGQIPLNYITYVASVLFNHYIDISIGNIIREIRNGCPF
jgi:hypothetical protein